MQQRLRVGGCSTGAHGQGWLQCAASDAGGRHHNSRSGCKNDVVGLVAPEGRVIIKVARQRGSTAVQHGHGASVGTVAVSGTRHISSAPTYTSALLGGYQRANCPVCLVRVALPRLRIALSKHGSEHGVKTAPIGRVVFIGGRCCIRGTIF